MAVWLLGLATELSVAVLVFTLIGLAAAAVGLIYPAIGLFGIGILCTTDTLARFGLLHGGWLRFNTFNYWLVLVILVYAPFLVRLRNSHCIIWQLLVLLLAIELIHSPDLFLGVNHLLGVVSPFGVLIYFVRTCRNQRLWYWMGIVNGALGAVGGGVIYATDNYLIRAHGNQFTFFPNAALFSICLASRYASANRRGQIPLLIMATLNFGWVLMTGSRGGLLISSCCMFFLLWELRGRWRRLFILATIALLATTACSLYPALVFRSLDRIMLLFDSDFSLRQRTSGRWDVALGGWYMLMDHPWGVGTGGFERTLANLDLQGGLSGFHAGKDLNAHAGWVRTLAENGLPGLLLHVALVVSFAVAGYRERHRGLLSLGVLVSATLCMVHVVHEFAPRGPWLLTAGAIVMLNRDEMQSALKRSLGR